MSVYEAVKVFKDKGTDKKDTVFLNKFLSNICSFGLGILFSLSGFSNGFSPFGVAFVSCLPRVLSISSAFGSVIGYFIALDSVEALRYTSTVFAVVVIMTAVKSVSKTVDKSIVASSVTFVCVLTTGIAVTLSNGVIFSTLFVNFCEALVGGVSAYVFAKSGNSIKTRHNIKSLTSKEITFIVITFSILLLSLRYATVFGVNIARIISVFLIVLCSFYGRESGGTIVGVCCGITNFLGNGNLFLLSFYSLGGLLSGAFSSFGRFMTFLSFLFSGMVIYVVSETTENILPYVIEVLIGGIVFTVLSFRFDYSFESFFTQSVSLPVINSFKTNIINKLHKASEFSEEICVTLDNVNNVLEKSDKKDYGKISAKAKETVCFNCGLYDNCWGEKEETVKKYLSELLELKMKGLQLDKTTVPQSFLSSCIRSESIVDTFNKLFYEYKLYEKTESRLRDIRGLASEQFMNMSNLLDSLCSDLNEDVRFDVDIAARCKTAAISCGADVIDSCCVYDSAEIMRIELRVKKGFNITFLNSISSEISAITGKKFNIPETEEFEDYTLIIYSEKSDYKAIVSVVQYNAPGEKFSGDTFTSFEDSKGFFYAIICDGMGTGAAAAVTSGLTVNLLEKLIKAGFSVESAVNTVNTSLISKSGDECSVTLDLFCFDLYTGRAQFYKCGAQDSVVKHRGKLSDVTASALPLGIIKDIEIDTKLNIFTSGDVIVLCSDGVREEDFYQLRNALKVFDNGDVKKFTAQISDNIRRSQPSKRDDFTLMTIAIANNK